MRFFFPPLLVLIFKLNFISNAVLGVFIGMMMLCVYCVVFIEAFTFFFEHTYYFTHADRNLLSTEIVAKAEDARERALDWLASQRNDEFGWGDGYSTAKVILALASSNQNWPQKSDLEARLSAKQLEVELLATLLRLALGFSCRNNNVLHVIEVAKKTVNSIDIFAME